MRKIVLSAIIALVATVGVYHVMLFGGREPAVTIIIMLAALVAGIAVLFAPTHDAVIASAAFTAFVATLATSTALTATGAGINAVVDFAPTFVVLTLLVIAFVGIIIAIFVGLSYWDAAEQEHIRMQWVVAASVMNAFAIWGALTIRSPGWSVAIVLATIYALLFLCRLVPEPSIEEKVAIAYSEERARIESRIAGIERELQAERDRLAALNSPPFAVGVSQNKDV